MCLEATWISWRILLTGRQLRGGVAQKQHHSRKTLANLNAGASGARKAALLPYRLHDRLLSLSGHFTARCMPRLLPSLLRQARLREPHAARLLPVCRDLASARNEVRWLKEHAKQEAFKRCEGTLERKLLSDLISRRASGQPLQYIIGSEYFGDLEIKCRPGVLIPRSVNCFFA